MRKFLLLLALLFAVPQNSFAQSITGNSGTVALAPISGINGFANTLTPFVTGFGYSACSGATGVGNTCIGSNAGSSLTTGTYNTIIGQGSVGTTATPTGGYVTNVGATNLPVITSASEVESFGGGNFDLCTSCSFSTGLGDDVLSSVVSGNYNVGVGNYALNGVTASNNTGLGWKAGGGATNSGANNTAVGFNALSGASQTGGQNVGVGAQSLAGDVGGYYNTAIGDHSGATITSGATNVCVGQAACNGITTGNENIILGYQTQSLTTSLSNAFGVYSAAASAPTIDYNITNASEFTFHQNIVSIGTTPTIASGACGATTNGTVAGSDNSGKVTIGASATSSCTISFHATLATAPSACIISAANAAAAVQVATVATGVYVTPPTTSQFVINGAVLANTLWEYFCL